MKNVPQPELVEGRAALMQVPPVIILSHPQLGENIGAQAVLIASYEWFHAGDATPRSRLERGLLQRKPTRAELLQTFEHLERELLDSGFLYPPDKVGAMRRAIRATLHRARLTYQETQTLRGMIVALTKGKHRVK